MAFSSFNGAVQYLLCVIHVSTKYAWIKVLKDKRLNKAILHGFIDIVKESKRHQANYGLFKKENFIMALWKNGYTQ